ncbi:MAG: type IV secretory system conjugative DNA transfer family protein, partial [Burkholderiaceae bacterium]
LSKAAAFLTKERSFSGQAKKEERAPAESFAEQALYPIEIDPAPSTISIRIPADFTSDIAQMRQLLLAFSSCLQPVSVEFVGHDGKVHCQLVCHEADQEHILATLAGHMPDIVPIPCDDLLTDAWSCGGQDAVIIDCALAHEFFLPIKTGTSFSVDPYIPLVSALARAREDECACVQVLFQRVINPWERSILDAVQAGGDGCIFSDAPEFVPLAKEKTQAPLFAVVLRVATQAESPERAWELVRTMQGFLLQFNRPGSNEFIPLENVGYPDDLHEDALLARVSYRAGMLLSLNELLGLAHFPDASVTHPAFVRLKHHTKAVPQEAEGHPFVLGRNEHRGVITEVTLSTEARMAHMHVVGASGTGKSSFLLSLIKQDIDHGESFAVLDPHGDLVDDILAHIPKHRQDHVIVFDPADEAWPIGFNILSAASEQEKTLLSSDLTGIFARFATSWGDVMNTVLGQAVLALLESERGGTLFDLRRFLVDERFRKDYLTSIPEQEIRFFWDKEYPLIGTKSIGPILTRLDTFLRSKLVRHIVGQKDAKLDLGSVMNNADQILLVKLSQGMIGEENAALLGSLLMSKFHQHALARQVLPKHQRRPFFLYADECQHFVTPSLEALYGEGRKYALGLTLAHQTLAQIERMPQVAAAILGNAYTRVVFRVGSTDAKQLAEGFAYFERDDIESLGRGQAIVRIGGASNDCNLSTILVQPLPAEEAKARTAAIIAQSRARFAMPLAELKEQFAEWYPQKEEPTPLPTPPTTKAPPTQEAPSKKIEIPQQPKTKRPEPPELPELGRGGAEHKYLQHLIKRLAEERGFRAMIEEAAGDGRADIVLKKDKLTIACEISVTTTVEHEVANLTKCLQSKPKFNHLIFICKDKRRRDKVQKLLASTQPEAANIIFIGQDDIVVALDQVDPQPKTTEGTIRGYKVKVSRQNLSTSDIAARRAVVAEVIARSLAKKEKI